jgi:hypothetical protein
MKISLLLYAKPFSINSAYYLKSFGKKSTTKIRTKECREWGDDILSQLQKRLVELREFRTAFDEGNHALKIRITHYIPKAIYYTKNGKGHISAATCDITNIEKLLVDLLFDARFNDRSIGGLNIENLNINDKFICHMVSRKIPSKRDYKIKILVEIIPKPDIEDEEMEINNET